MEKTGNQRDSPKENDMVDDVNQSGHGDIDWEKEWSDFYEKLDLGWITTPSSVEKYDDFKFSLKNPSMNCPNHSRVKRLAVIEALAEPEDSHAYRTAIALLSSCPTCAFICQKIMENFHHAVVNRQRIDDEYYSQD